MNIDKKLLLKAIRTTFTNQLMFSHLTIFLLMAINKLSSLVEFTVFFELAQLGLFLVIFCQILSIYFAYNREAGKL